MPAEVPILYRALTGYLVALLGVAYGWLAAAPRPHREFIAFGAFGKAGVFLLATLLWFGDEIGTELLIIASGDGVFAAIWLTWLVRASAADRWSR